MSQAQAAINPLPEVDTLFLPKTEVEVYPGSSPQVLTLLAVNQQTLINEFNQHLEQFQRQVELQTQIYEKQVSDLRNEQLDITANRGAALTDLSGIPWNKTSQGEKLVLRLDTELGKDLDLPSAVRFSKDTSVVEKFLVDWTKHVDNLKKLTTIIDVSTLPSPPAPAENLDPSERLLTKSEQQRVRTALSKLSTTYDKFVPTSNRIAVYETLLQTPISDLETADNTSGLVDDAGAPVKLLPANFDQLRNFFSPTIQTSKLSDITATSRDILLNALGTSKIVTPQLVIDSNFLQSASVINLIESLQAGLAQSKLDNARLKKDLGLDYLSFTNKLTEIRAAVFDRVGQEYNAARRVSVTPDPRLAEVRKELADLSLQIDALNTYLPASTGALKDTFNQMKAEINALDAKLNSLLADYKQSNISAQLIWPKFNDPKFNLGIVGRMKNPDPGSSTFPVNALPAQPSNAKMTRAVNAEGEVRESPSGTEIPIDRSVTPVEPLGSCDSTFGTYREYQKFLAAYLFGPDQGSQTTPDPSLPDIFPISPYRGVLANWGVGTGKTNGGMKAMVDFFDNYDKRYQNGAIPRIDADLSNFVVLWVPNKNLQRVWGDAIEQTFAGRATPVAANLFSTATRDIFDQHWYVNANGRIERWNPTVDGLYQIDSGPNVKFITISTLDDLQVAKLVWAEIPTNFILHKLRFPGLPIALAETSSVQAPSLVLTPAKDATGAPLLNPVNGEQVYERSFDPSVTLRFADAVTEIWDLNKPRAASIRSSFAQELKQFSPFVVFDEVHNWFQAGRATNRDQKAWKKFIWSDIYPGWIWSKILALSATPFDPSKPNFEDLGQLVQFLKYFPGEIPAGQRFRDVFPSGLSLNAIVVTKDGVKKVQDTPAMNNYFSKWLSYVSLNFDTTLYPFYNSLVCTVDESKFCVSTNKKIEAVTSETEFIKSFVETPSAQVPGKSTEQQVIRDLREWKYTVPNLVNVYLDESSLVEINAQWSRWTSDEPTPYHLSRFYNLESFEPDTPVTPLEDLLIKPGGTLSAAKRKYWDEPKVTVSPLDLDPAQLANLRTFWNQVAAEAGQPAPSDDQLRLQRILDITGYAGSRIVYNSTTSLKELSEKIVVGQPLAVGGFVGAREKGRLCFKMIDVLPDKFIFIQTSINNVSLAYDNFWRPFFEELPANIEVFQEVPSGWDLVNAGETAKSSSNPNDPAIPNPWWKVNSGTAAFGPTADTKKVQFTESSGNAILAAVESWYSSNGAAKRVIYLGDKYVNTSQAKPLFAPIAKFWQGLFNNYRNFDGSYFQAIFLDPAGAEGTSFFDVTTHVNLNPPQNITVKTQAEGRAFRQCAFSQLAWHHTTVTAEVDNTTGNTIRYVTDPSPPGGDNGIYPEVKMFTLIARIDPATNNPSPMKITPDELMADYIYKDPNMEGDMFLRYLQSLAIDNLLFGDPYSHVKTPAGTEAQVEGLWTIADELVYRAANFVIDDPAERKDYVDYVLRFYSGPPSATEASPPPGITEDEVRGRNPRDVYKRFMTGISKGLIEKYATDPSVMKDLFAKLVYFAGNSLSVPTDESFFGLGVFKAFSNWKQGKTLNPIGDTIWFKSTYLPELNQLRLKNSASITLDRFDIIQRQAEWIQNMSAEYVPRQEEYALSSYFAKQPSKNFVPKVGYYQEMETKNPGAYPDENAWFKDAVSYNVDKGPGSYESNPAWKI